MDKMLTVKDVAAVIGCCENTARDMMRQMPHFVAPGSNARKTVRVWQSDLILFLRTNTVDPNAKKGRKYVPRPVLRFTEGLDEQGRIPRRRA